MGSQPGPLGNLLQVPLCADGQGGACASSSSQVGTAIPVLGLNCFSCSSVKLLMFSQLFFCIVHGKRFDSLGNCVPLPPGLPKKSALTVAVP